MKDGSWQLQQAIVNRLTIGANKIIYPVFDGVQDDQEVNYIEIQNVTSEDDSAKSCPIEEIVFNFNCWSIHKGKMELYAMFNAIGESLTFANSQVQNPLTMEDFYLSYSERQGTLALKQARDSYFIYQGVYTCLFRVKEKEII